MGDLAQTYSKLGRHSEALAMRESVLEFRRRVLPAEHPGIGEGRVWSAAVCFFLSECFYVIFLFSFFATPFVFLVTLFTALAF